MNIFPKIMGIVNVTPDSFSDGGAFFDADKAIAHGLALAAQGADILDIGGESTKPDAEPVLEKEEIRRVVPVIEGLKHCGKIISIDTRHAATMEAALAAGAGFINDVAALREAGTLEIAAQADVPVCLMHMQGDPKTMQIDPQYDDVMDEIKSFISQRVDAFLAAGGKDHNVVIDPGIGFGKTVTHNITILQNIAALKALGFSVLIGLSRKRFIAALDNETAHGSRLGGSLAGALWAAEQGADIIRVHDVGATRQALKIQHAIKG